MTNLSLRLRTAGLVAALATTTIGCSYINTEARAAPAPLPTQGAKTGGVLRIGITQPGSIDPGNAYEPAGRLVVSAMCQPLVQLDPVTGEPQPGLAKKWAITDDGAHMTISLRHGQHYSDGSVIDAKSVVYALSRVAKQDFASYQAGLLSPLAGFDVIHNGAKSDVPRDLEQLHGLRIIDPYGFELRLHKNADFIRTLADISLSPISKRAEQRDPRGFAHQPVCAGPYQLTQKVLDTDRVIRLTKNPHFLPAVNSYTGGGGGWADEIDFKIYDTAAAALEGYKKGEVDAAPVGIDNLAEARGLGDALVSGNGAELEFVTLPSQPGTPFESPAVHIALSQALDRKKIAHDVYDDGRDPATGFVPAWAGDSFTPNACGANAPAGGNVAAARALLAKAHVDLNGKSSKLYFNDEFRNARLYAEIASQWRAAFGLKLELTPLPWDKFRQQLHSGAGFDGPFRSSWSGPNSSPEAYLAPLFLSSGLGTSNVANFSNDDFDRAFRDGAEKQSNVAERRLDYMTLETAVCRIMPMIPVTFTKSLWVVRRQTIGSARPFFLDVNGNPALREWYLKPAAG